MVPKRAVNPEVKAKAKAAVKKHRRSRGAASTGGASGSAPQPRTASGRPIFPPAPITDGLLALQHISEARHQLTAVRDNHPGSQIEQIEHMAAWAVRMDAEEAASTGAMGSDEEWGGTIPGSRALTVDVQAG